MERRQAQRPLALFLQFFQFGCFTFGGGWSIIAQMQKRYVEQAKTLTSQELLDLTSVGKSLPGVMVVNVSMLYGVHAGGVLGGVACVLGIAAAPMMILSVIAGFYSAFQSNPWVMAAMTGVRSAVVPIIVSAAAAMLKGSFRFPPCVLIALLTFALYLFFGVSCVWLVVIGAVCGVAVSEFYERREGPGRDPS